jgi:predicted Rossmann fold flavoprotein
MKFDVCIIGGGAAGLMASIFAAQTGAKVAIVEKNTTVGRKLLKTGRGRCNITHTGTIDDFVREYDFCGRFLKHCLYEFPPEAVRQFFAQKGLATKVEKDGCVFPLTDRATDVSRVLVDAARRNSVQFIYGRAIEAIEKQFSGGFILKAGNDRYECAVVILASGGASWPQTGSTGDGYALAQAFGHTLIESKAALAPMTAVETWPGTLQGVGVPDVRVSVVLEEKKVQAAGPLMFTEDGVGGPVILDLSRAITDYLHDHPEPLPIKLDLCPSKDFQQLETFLLDGCAAHPKQEIARVVTELLPRAMTLYVAQQIQTDGRPILSGQLSKESRRELIRHIKEVSLTIKAIRPLSEATITRGGVSLDEIEPTTMQSRICPGLFFAGEVMNADGPCGGYNLQIAWSTGSLAGKNAALFCKPT